MFYTIPLNNPTAANPILQRFLQENAAVSAGNWSGRRRPQPPRSLFISPGSQQVLLSWQPPQNTNGILSYNVYKDNENNRVLNINDPATRQVTISLPGGGTHAFYVSTYNAQQESVKVLAAGAPTTDEYVVTGTGGGTPGTYPGLPPGFQLPQLPPGIGY
jgi:hypothetical protein